LWLKLIKEKKYEEKAEKTGREGNGKIGLKK